VQVREAICTCISGGVGRAFGVVWDSGFISESELPSNPQDACEKFQSALQWPIWAGWAGVDDYVHQEKM